MGQPLHEAALEHLAMQYAIASLDIRHDYTETVFSVRPRIDPATWDADQLKTEMHHRFGVYETQEAIKRATEVIRMVIPKT